MLADNLPLPLVQILFFCVMTAVLLFAGIMPHRNDDQHLQGAAALLPQAYLYAPPAETGTQLRSAGAL